MKIIIIIIMAVASSVYGIIRVKKLWYINYIGRVDKSIENFGISPLKNFPFEDQE